MTSMHDDSDGGMLNCFAIYQLPSRANVSNRLMASMIDEKTMIIGDGD